MFRGAIKVTLDAKGRLAIPTRHREPLHARSDGRLVVTVDPDHCLLVYPGPEWDDIERKLVRLPSLNKQVRRLKRLMLGNAADVDIDGHGRILLPRELRDFARLERTAMFVGQGNKFEIWDEDTWNQKRESWLDEEEDMDLSTELESLVL